jgi:hypothetical protein
MHPLIREQKMQQDPELKELTDYSEDGVDLTLIRWFLSLTPAERLAFLNQHMNKIHAIRKLNRNRVSSPDTKSGNPDRPERTTRRRKRPRNPPHFAPDPEAITLLMKQ